MKTQQKNQLRKFNLARITIGVMLIMASNIQASTIAPGDFEQDNHGYGEYGYSEYDHSEADKNDHHGAMDKFSHDAGDGSYEGYCDTRDSNNEHTFSPFCASKPGGLDRAGHEWKPGSFGDEGHQHTPFGSNIPPGHEKHGHEWRPHTYKHGDDHETVVPIPAAVWLFGSGFMGLVALTRRKI